MSSSKASLLYPLLWLLSCCMGLNKIKLHAHRHLDLFCLTSARVATGSDPLAFISSPVRGGSGHPNLLQYPTRMWVPNYSILVLSYLVGAKSENEDWFWGFNDWWTQVLWLMRIFVVVIIFELVIIWMATNDLARNTWFDVRCMVQRIFVKT